MASVQGRRCLQAARCLILHHLRSSTAANLPFDPAAFKGAPPSRPEASWGPSHVKFVVSVTILGGLGTPDGPTLNAEASAAGSGHFPLTAPPCQRGAAAGATGPATCTGPSSASPRPRSRLSAWPPCSRAENTFCGQRRALINMTEGLARDFPQLGLTGGRHLAICHCTPDLSPRETISIQNFCMKLPRRRARRAACVPCSASPRRVCSFLSPLLFLILAVKGT